MVHTLNPDDVLEAVKALLDADTTLQNSQHLDSTTKVYVGRCPNDKQDDLPYIVVTLLPMSLTDRNLYVGECRATARCRLLDNGQIDQRSERIVKQSVNALSEEFLSITGGAGMPLLCLGIIPAFVDLAHPRESVGVARFRVEAGMNG